MITPQEKLGPNGAVGTSLRLMDPSFPTLGDALNVVALLEN